MTTTDAGADPKPRNVRFTEDIREDALRRDFTVNALYMGADGTVADPTGRGIAALAGKRSSR